MEKTNWIYSLSGPNRKSKIQNPKWGGLVALVVAFAICGAAAQAQQPKKVFRVGILENVTSPRTEAFRQGLRDLGYVEGQNLAIESRFGTDERLPDLAAELVRLKVDVVFAPNTNAIQAAKNATRTIPIVMAVPSDAIGSGFITSLAQPGGNITGLTSIFAEVSAKRLELFKEALPRMTRVAVLVDPARPWHSAVVKALEETAGSLRLKLQLLEVRQASDLDTASSAISRNKAEALFLAPNPVFFVERRRLAEFASKLRLPSSCVSAEFAEAGCLTFEYRFSEQKPERLSELATDLVRLKLDLIVVTSNPASLAAKSATATIPIVMTTSTDPVGVGLVASLARLGGNVTGLSSLAVELNTKMLEILKDAILKLGRAGLLRSPGTSTTSVLQLKELRAAALALKLKLEEIEMQPDAKGLESAFQTAKQKQVGAIMTNPDSRFFDERKQIVELAGKYRLPAIYPQKEFVDDSGLMSYGADSIDLYRRAAVYVDKLLKGAKPADLPVQQATKFEFVINLKAAKQIGLMIPPNVLARADRVIK